MMVSIQSAVVEYPRLLEEQGSDLSSLLLEEKKETDLKLLEKLSKLDREWSGSKNNPSLSNPETDIVPPRWISKKLLYFIILGLGLIFEILFAYLSAHAILLLFCFNPIFLGLGITVLCVASFFNYRQFQGKLLAETCHISFKNHKLLLLERYTEKINHLKKIYKKRIKLQRFYKTHLADLNLIDVEIETCKDEIIKEAEQYAAKLGTQKNSFCKKGLKRLGIAGSVILELGGGFFMIKEISPIMIAAGISALVWPIIGLTVGIVAAILYVSVRNTSFQHYLNPYDEPLGQFNKKLSQFKLAHEKLIENISYKGKAEIVATKTTIRVATKTKALVRSLSEHSFFTSTQPNIETAIPNGNNDIKQPSQCIAI